MPTVARLLTGFAAALLAGWIAHGPLGRGAMFIDSVQAQAEQVVRDAALPGVTVSLARDPFARVATLAGPANDFQREGQGDLPGLNDRIAAVPGVSAVRWADAASPPGGFPVLAETLILVALAFLIGLGLGRLFFGRPRQDGFL